MGLGELAAWQWRDYGQYHQTRRNLLVHAVAVPLFLAGNAAVLAGAVVLLWPVALAGLALSALAFAVQGLGHKGEPVPPVPFRGPADVAGRILVEQWVTFPRFVLSGEWKESLDRARRNARPAGAPL